MCFQRRSNGLRSHTRVLSKVLGVSMTGWPFSVRFFDRLVPPHTESFAGRRILNMQTNLTLLNSSAASQTPRFTSPTDDREPFQHVALEGLEYLTDTPIAEVLTKARLAKFASQLDMAEIMRWRPRNVRYGDSDCEKYADSD